MVVNRLQKDLINARNADRDFHSENNNVSQIYTYSCGR
jgi:hypothetical protein